jgi:hypothetical protein
VSPLTQGISFPSCRQLVLVEAVQSVADVFPAVGVRLMLWNTHDAETLL